MLLFTGTLGSQSGHSKRHTQSKWGYISEAREKEASFLLSAVMAPVVIDLTRTPVIDLTCSPVIDLTGDLATEPTPCTCNSCSPPTRDPSDFATAEELIQAGSPITPVSPIRVTFSTDTNTVNLVDNTYTPSVEVPCSEDEADLPENLLAYRPRQTRSQRSNPYNRRRTRLEQRIVDDLHELKQMYDTPTFTRALTHFICEL